MSARRSTRERKKPKQIYEVLDTRLADEGANADGTAKDNQVNDADDHQMSEEESEGESNEEEEEEADAREFAPKKPKVRAKPAAAPGTRRGAATKRKPLVRPRKLKPVQEERRSKGLPGDGANEEDDDEDAEDGDGDDVFFEVTKRGNASLRTLLIEWHSRYEEDSEEATREILNFVLQACGGEGQCVPTTEKLEKLDMSDLVDYVVEDLRKSNDGYPIVSRMKGFKHFKRNFVEFWKAFVTECYEDELLFTSTVVHQFVDWLTTLTSAEIRAIRHTSTIGAYAIGSALVGSAQNISQQLEVVKRQLNAEINSSSKNSKAKATPMKMSKKMQLLTDNKNMYENRLQRVVQVVDILFTGVIVHRYRDVMPEVRTESAETLGNWIAAMPDHFLKDNYLKYLGWMLNDKEASVRLSVVNLLRSLYEHEEFTDKLELFTSRFLPRYLELCNDVDDSVVQACVRLLIAVDKRSLISSDVELQPVERLVFEPENAEIRKAAAEFICLQYDAFGVAESKLNPKLKRDQLNTQAIALVEFAEDYIFNHHVPADSVETLVEAFWGLEDCQVLQDWKLLTDLLLSEKSDLTSDQLTILIRLLVSCIRKITTEESDRSSAAQKKKTSEDREEITVAFCKDIPSLLVRFQSDSEKLSLLVELIPMLSLRADIVGQHLGHVKSLIEKLQHAFLNNSEEKFLTTISLSIHHLFQAEHEVIKRETEVIIHEIFQDLLEKTRLLLEDDAKLFEDPQDSSKSTLGKRTSKQKAKDLTDVEYALRVSLCRLACMIRYINVRDYLPSTSGSSTSRQKQDNVEPANKGNRMGGIVSGLAALIRRRTRNIPLLDEELWQADTLKHSLMVLYLDLLWCTSSVFKTVESQNKRRVEEANEDEAQSSALKDFNEQSVRDQIEKVCKSRSYLEDCLISVLEMHLETTKRSNEEEQKDGNESEAQQPTEIALENEQISAYVKESQRFAFLTFCDIRCLFVEKFQEATPPYDTLSWTLPKILVLLTQMYFEDEMEAPDDEEPDMEKEEGQGNGHGASEVLQIRKAELLVALSRVSMSNPSNKRQSAAVLRYFTEDSKHSVDIVKAFSKQVKNDTPVRYLEVQMTALRQQYNSILALQEELEAVKNSDVEDEDVRQELQETIKNSELQLKELAKKLSQSLGVGKVAATLRAPFFRFLCEGVRYSLEKQEHFAFLEPLRPYLSHLDPSSMKQLRAYFLQLLEELNESPEEEEQLSNSWRIVFDFQSAMSNSVSKKERKIINSVLSSTSDEPRTSAHEQQNAEDEDVQRLKLVPKKRKRESLQQDSASDVGQPEEISKGTDEGQATAEQEANDEDKEILQGVPDVFETPKKRPRQPPSPPLGIMESSASVEERPNDHHDLPSQDLNESETRKRDFDSILSPDQRRTRSSFSRAMQARRESKQTENADSVPNDANPSDDNAGN
uniref:SCD domain-containing protein n=1 Tax=Globisporangium ultimum (strain ATCC 200006 / CBS 805.95 / DAOM BR144) TaxID=431595 RepID=K3X2X3_GLOUD